MNKKDTISRLRTRVTLLARLKGSWNNEESWEEFYLCYQRYILSLLTRYGINYHDCEDLSQTVLLKAWKGLKHFDYEEGKGLFRSWLATITNNTARDFLRRQSGKKAQVAAGEDEHFIDQHKTHDDPEVKNLIQNEWEKYISEKAWSLVQPKLSEKVRLVFEGFLEGREIAEMAESFELSENTVYVYRQRVEKQLMKEIVRLDYELS